MKKILFILMTLAVVLSSCNDYETYGDKKEKERNAIAKFIADSSIVVISEDQFKQQGMTTDVKRNEFVKFDKNGVYMQIVRSGCGTGLGAKESTTLVCRYREFNILNDTIQSWNDTPHQWRHVYPLWWFCSFRLDGAPLLHQGGSPAVD